MSNGEVFIQGGRVLDATGERAADVRVRIAEVDGDDGVDLWGVPEREDQPR